MTATDAVGPWFTRDQANMNVRDKYTWGCRLEIIYRYIVYTIKCVYIYNILLNKYIYIYNVIGLRLLKGSSILW